MTASARALKEIVLRCRQCGRHAVATRAGQVCATHAEFQGWEVAHLAYMEPSPAAPDLHEGGGQLEPRADKLHEAHMQIAALHLVLSDGLSVVDPEAHPAWVAAVQAHIEDCHRAACDEWNRLCAKVEASERLRIEAQALRAYAEHKAGCPIRPREDGAELMSVITYDRVAETISYSKELVCNCGLASLLADPPATDEGT